MNFIQLKKLPDLLITPEFLTSSEVKTIPIAPFPGASSRNCTHNVKLYIASNGGSAEFGWAVASLGNVLIRFVGHCVVGHARGGLVCITPPECSYMNQMAFIPDQSIAAVEQNRGRLPSLTYPLINDPVAIEYADLDNDSSKIRCKYPPRSSLNDFSSFATLSTEDSKVMSEVTLRARRLMPELQALVARTYGPNQYCFCNSGEKYKRCCQDKMKALLRKRT